MKNCLTTVCALSALVIAACSNNARVGACQGACTAGMICNTASGECVSTSPEFPGSGLPCDVAAVLQNHCLSCHGSQPAGGAPNSLVTRTQLLSASPAGGTYAVRAALRMRDAQSPMPPSSTGDVVSAEERAAFENWVTGNYPGGSCNDATATAAGGGDGSTGGGDGSTGGGVGSSGGGDGSTGGGAGATGGGTATQGGGTATQGGGAATQGGGVGATGGGSAASGGGTGTSEYCAPCISDADCGGNGNFCIGFSFGDYCGTDCTSTTCATDERCANIVDSSNTVLGKNCVPLTGATCTSGAGGGTGTTGGGSGATGGGAATTGGGTGTSGGGTGTTDAGVCTTDTWSSWAQNFFNTKCNSCHAHTGEFTQSHVASYESSIYSRINSGSMPQGSTLSSADKQRILKYLSCGVP